MLPALWSSPAAAELFGLIPARDRVDYLAEREKALTAMSTAMSERRKANYDPTGYEVRGAMIAAEAAGKPISEDEAIALLKAHQRDAAA